MASGEPCNLGDIFAPSGDGDKVTLIDCRDWQTPREYSRHELDAAADACARGLLARGLKPGQTVAILSANRAEFMIAYLGVLRAGLVAVPVNFKFPAETIDFILQDASVRTVICDGERRRGLQTNLPVIDFDDAGEDGFEALLDPGPFDAARPNEDDVAMVLYTSGSTGRPKGVPLTHKGHLWAHLYRLDRGGRQDHHRFLVAAPLYHMNALCITLLAFGAGASLVLLPEFTPERYIAAIERFQCTMLTSVPTMLAMCFNQPALMAKADLSSVKVVRMGSAPV
ncbi:MAG: long-chain fatty acid--CoA ligase, partial [Alphaproteobacteria bacterium]|nr:long-chain fatty acid--CoA ligase [Alphaproteobacteria bacterium]